MALTEVLPDLHLFEDTCNVYILRDGDPALLIDCGSGDVLDHLSEVGIAAVDWVLFTHHHRDQCFGAHRLVEAGAELAVPRHERELFARASDYWQQKRIFDNYNDRSTFFSIGEDLPVRESLCDYETFSWGPYHFEVVPAPGHTQGQIALVAQIGGQCVAFTGDLIRAGGKLHELHAMEYDYGDFIGVHWTSASLAQLRKRNLLHLLLPSHGEAITEPSACLDELDGRLHRLLEHIPYRIGPAAGMRFAHEAPMAQLSEHLLWSDEVTCSNFYVIRADSGKALFIDYPYFSNGIFMQALHNAEAHATVRFIEHHLDELRDRWGVGDIDVVIPTHIHDDHVCGIPYLQRHCDTQVWALDQVAKVLQEPQAWNTPCLLELPIPCDRIFTDGERFEWEGFRFEIVFYPGQTEFHSAILCENLDGRRVLFAGDSSYPMERYTPGADGWMVNTVLRNSLTFGMHWKCADEFDRLRADFLCPGHGPVWDVPREAFAQHRQYVREKESLWREVLPEPAEPGVDLFWARLVPYQIQTRAGEDVEVVLELRNSFERPATFRVHLQGPDGIEITPKSREAQLAPAEKTALSWTLLAGELPADSRRHLLCAHIDVDGRPLGPVAEALVSAVE